MISQDLTQGNGDLSHLVKQGRTTVVKTRVPEHQERRAQSNQVGNAAHANVALANSATGEADPRLLALIEEAAAEKEQKPIPRDLHWWISMIVMLLSIFLVFFALHGMAFGWLQHQRDQLVLFSQFRSELAQGITPTGQLDVNETLVSDGTPVAMIEIPSIGVKEVISQGTDSKILRNGPGPRSDTGMPVQSGTSVLMGRQATYGGPFAKLSMLQPGDIINVTTAQGVAKFTVFGMRHAGDKLPDAVTGNHGRLELITADGLPLFSTGALHVDAELVSEPFETSSKVFTAKALPDAEQPMGSNRSYMLAAANLAVLLIAAGYATYWAWNNWGRAYAWTLGVPVILCLMVVTADAIYNIVPNLV